MDANTPYEVIQYVVNKNQQGYVSPDQFNLIINEAQREYFDYLLGEYQKYQAGRPVSVVQFSQNERLRTSMAPLIYGTTLSPNTTTGIAAFPSDFEEVDAMWSMYGVYNIRFAQQPRASSFVRSTIDPIEQNPIYLIQHEGFHFYPENIGSAKMSYVRTPPSIIWAYTVDANGLPVYNPLASVAPVWSDNDMMNIISRALRLVSVNLEASAVAQYATEVKQIGQ